MQWQNNQWQSWAQKMNELDQINSELRNQSQVNFGAGQALNNLSFAGDQSNAVELNQIINLRQQSVQQALTDVNHKREELERMVRAASLAQRQADMRLANASAMPTIAENRPFAQTATLAPTYTAPRPSNLILSDQTITGPASFASANTASMVMSTPMPVLSGPARGVGAAQPTGSLPWSGVSDASLLLNSASNNWSFDSSAVLQAKQQLAPPRGLASLLPVSIMPGPSKQLAAALLPPRGDNAPLPPPPHASDLSGIPVSAALAAQCPPPADTPALHLSSSGSRIARWAEQAAAATRSSLPNPDASPTPPHPATLHAAPPPAAAAARAPPLAAPNSEDSAMAHAAATPPAHPPKADARKGAAPAGGGRGRGHCEHGRRRSDCKECKGAGICEHNKRRSLCKDCGGSCICQHGRIRYQCKLCGGSQICQHNRRRSHCKDCRGSAICEHRRQRHQCKQCNGQDSKITISSSLNPPPSDDPGSDRTTDSRSSRSVLGRASTQESPDLEGGSGSAGSSSSTG